MDKIRINVTKLSLFAYHGVHDEEQRLGQRFYVDLALTVGQVSATQTDLLDGTISYEHVIQEVSAIFCGEKFRTIERAARSVSDAVMARFPSIESLTVTVHKPSAPVAAIFDDVAVSVEANRNV
jgi:dihydroneopterin aldolase